MNDPLVNQQFGQYFVQERVQSGGMAVVYKAFDQRRQQLVALKIMHENFADKPQIVLRFKREAEIAQKLSHPHIVPFYDFGEVNGKLYMTMRFMDGGSLSERLQKVANTPLGETVSWLRQIAGALDFAHNEGVVHRDLKPGNILLTKSGEAYLSDFGIAKISEATQLTVTGQGIPGTARYMSPEQARGDSKLDHRSDIYSLGVIAYLLATGYYPFTGETDTVVVNKHIHEIPPLPTAANKSLPPALDGVLNRVLSKHPAERYPTAGAFVTALERAIAGYEDLIVIVTPGAANPVSSTGSSPPPPVAAIPAHTPPPLAPAKPFYASPIVWVGVPIIVLLAALLFVLVQMQSGDDEPTAENTGIAAVDTGAPTDDPLVIVRATRDAELAITAAWETVLAQEQTETAESWTDTPTEPLADTSTAAPSDTPTDTATATSTDAPTDTATDTPTATITDTPTNTATATLTNTATETASVTSTDTSSPTDEPTNVPRIVDTNTPTDTATATDIPTSTSTDTPPPTATDTATPTESPSATSTSTNTPRPTSTRRPSSTPSNTPTATDTATNTPRPTDTDTPTNIPSRTPTATNTLLVTRDVYIGTVNLSRETYLSLYSRVGTGSETMAQIPGGTQLVIHGRTVDGYWLYASFEDQEGWVTSQYVSITFNGNSADINEVPFYTSEGVVIPSDVDIIGNVLIDQGANLNLRVNPDSQSEVLARIPGETQMVVNGRTADGLWLHVTYDGQEGWVASAYVLVTLDGEAVEVDEIPVFDGQETRLSPTETSVPAETSTPTITFTPEPCYVRTDNAETAIRVGPGTTRGVRAFMPVDEDVLVVGVNVDADENTWWQIQPEDYNEAEADRYWVAEADVEEIGGCDQVAAAAGSAWIPDMSGFGGSSDGEDGDDGETTTTTGETTCTTLAVGCDIIITMSGRLYGAVPAVGYYPYIGQVIAGARAVVASTRQVFEIEGSGIRHYYYFINLEDGRTGWFELETLFIATGIVGQSFVFP